VLWVVSLPVLAFVLAVQLALVLFVLVCVLGLLGCGMLLAAVRPATAQPLFRWVERQAERLESHPGEIARRIQRLVAPIYPLMRLHSALYNRFYFRRFRAQLTALLVTRTIYCGAGAVAFDGGPFFRLAQRPPFLRTLASPAVSSVPFSRRAISSSARGASSAPGVGCISWWATPTCASGRRCCGSG
jgi:hypothetical protein